MSRSIGWYIHHQGRGHLTRLLAIAPQLDARIRCFSSLPQPDDLPAHCSWTLLPPDDDAPAGTPDPREADPTAGGLLHWAPLGHTGHLGRLAAIATSLAEDPVDVFVVDVSVEVVLLARLLGIRVVSIAQPGRRYDAAHQLGYRAATTILAPWPRELLEPDHFDGVAAKTVYTGGISRFEDRIETAPVTERGEDVVLLGGRGGSALIDADIASAERASGRGWLNLGATPDAVWSSDPWEHLTTAGVVVAWAGQNSVADLAAAEAPAVVIPQDRPFAEQHETARALQRAGLAVVATDWPAADAWGDLFAAAIRLHADWSAWQVPGAAARAARAIEETASGCR